MPHYVVVLPLAPLALYGGFSMSAWPLHVTIVPNFSTEDGPAAVGDALGPTPPAMDVVVGDEAMFGARENVRVALVEHSSALVAAHRELVARIRSAGAEFENPGYLDEGYRPHITATRRASAVQGERFRFVQLALVDMTPHGDAGLRRVVWTAALDDSLNT
jgi:2'-5' RNA ligase